MDNLCYPCIIGNRWSDEAGNLYPVPIRAVMSDAQTDEVRQRIADDSVNLSVGKQAESVGKQTVNMVATEVKQPPKPKVVEVQQLAVGSRQSL